VIIRQPIDYPILISPSIRIKRYRTFTMIKKLLNKSRIIVPRWF